MQDNYLQNFHLLYGSLPYAIEIISPDGSVVYVNPAFTFMWGFNIDELKEYNLYEDAELKKINISLKIGDVLRYKSEIHLEDYSDSLLKGRDITIPILKTKIFPLTIDSIDLVVLLHEDQTDQILTEAEIKKARDESREAERLKNTFLNVLSHELRTPLNIILGYSSIIRESMRDKFNAEDRVYLDNLYAGSERLFKSITQMLEFAQIEAGNYNMNIETIELISILKNSIGLIKENADEKNINIKLRFMASPILVAADSQSIENAVNNLLNNAVKFTKQGFIEVEANILEDREYAICKIKDTGVGISSEYLDHLFRPFSQEDLNIGRNYEGNGLGLALAKRYLEKMGGSLFVESIKGVGSTFTFTIPLAQTSYKGKSSSKDKVQEDLKKILMLDSSLETYDLLSAFLKTQYAIKAVDYSGFNPAMVHEDNYDIIIFEVDQNVWDEGLDYCRKIRKISKKKIIILSSEFLEEKIRSFFEAGADKFLIKPFSKTDLLNAIDELKIN